MGSGSKTTTKTTASNNTQPTVPSYISDPYQGYLGQVNQLAQLHGSDFTTPATANQNQAFQRAGQGTGDVTGAAQAATANMLGYTPQQVSATGYNAATYNPTSYNASTYDPSVLAGTDLSPYMNPFQQSVINSTLADFGQGNAQGLNQLRSLTPTGAFNGSRQGVAEGQLTSDNMRTLASTLAALNSQNFTQAQNAAVGDINTRNQAGQFNAGQTQSAAAANAGAANTAGAVNAAAQNQASSQNVAQMLQAALANQGADLSGAGVRLNAANQLGNLGLAGAANTRADTQQMADLGATERGINQDNNPNVAQSQLLQLLQSLYGTSPGMFIGQQSNGTQTSTQKSDPGLLASLGTILQGIGSMQKIQNPFAGKG